MNRDCSYIFTRKDGLPSDGELTYTCKIGSNKVHLYDYMLVSDLGGMEVFFYEAPTISSFGTEIKPTRKTRNDDLASTSTIYANSSFSSFGTELTVVGMPSNHPSAHITAADEGSPWDLKINTEYVIRIVNLEPEAKTLYTRFNWVEKIKAY